MFLSTGSLGVRFTLHAPRHVLSSTSSTALHQTYRSFPYHLAVRCTNLAPSKTPSSRPSSASFFTPSLCRVTRRHASTVTTSSPTSVQAGVLDWNTFFRLRTSRRRYFFFSSVVSSFVSTATIFVVLSSQPELADQITSLVPADTFVSLGIATFGATALGWLIGPVFGNALWKLLYRSRLTEFNAKERVFFERIKRHRVNPTGASTNNPVPDYYGEKIGSVSGYRRWLKDQRAFNRKREGGYSATI